MDQQQQQQQQQQQNNILDDAEDCSSFSSVTTLTETQSQQSITPSIINTDDEEVNDRHETDLQNNREDEEENNNNNNIDNNDDKTLLRQFENLEILLSEQSEVPDTIKNHFNEIKESYLIQQSQNNNNNESNMLGLDSNVDKLKSLAMRYSELMSSVDHKSRSMVILKNANHELNQYITNMENYHTMEMATLKAKISLTRIENEVRSSASAETASSKSSMKVKKRRSSLLRFFTSSSKAGSSSSLNTSSSSLDTVHSSSAAAEKSKLREDLLKKTIIIEELQKQCQDYDQRGKILESAVHNKNIELSVKNNRLVKLNDDIKSHVSSRAHFVAILNELEDTVISLNKKLNHTQNEMRENRDKTKDNQKKVQRMEWILNKTNEENKLLLARLNTKNYEMSCKKLEHEHLFGEVKRFLLSIISVIQQQDSDDGGGELDQTTNNNDDNQGSIDDDQEKILKRLMKISKKKLSKLCKGKSTTIHAISNGKKAVSEERRSTAPPTTLSSSKSVDQSSQTSVGPSSDNNNNQMNHHINNHPNNQMMTPEMTNHNQYGYQRRTGGYNSSPSFLPMNLENMFPNQQQKQQQQQQTSHQQYQKAFDDYNNLFTNEFLGYVEYIKNKEISSYKDDLKGLEKENYMLKNSLNQTNQKVRKLQVEMNYTKTKQQPLPSSPFTLPSLPSMSSPLNDLPMTQHRVIGSVGPSIPATPPAVATPLSSQLPLLTTDDVFPISSSATSTTSSGGLIPDDIRLIPDAHDCYDQALGSVGGSGNHEMFYQSFEKSNELIQGIFQEKNALEKQLQLSRQQRRKNTTATT